MATILKHIQSYNMSGYDRNQTLPVMGLGTSLFYWIHVAAEVAMLISISFSIGVIVFQSITKAGRPFFQRTVGERLTIYLALVDLAFSSSHLGDHTYMLITEDHPPDALCVTFAFILLLFVTSQSLIVFITAIVAFSMVVRRKKADFGTYDWKLLLIAFGIPVVFSGSLAGAAWLGPSGAWCLVDMRKPVAVIANSMISVMLVLVFCASTICYLAIWLILHRADKRLNATSSPGGAGQRRGGRAQRTARTMTTFVVAYMVQYVAYVVYSVWSFFSLPPASLLLVNVIMVNSGGVYNALAHTFIKVYYEKRGQEKEVTNKTSGRQNGGNNVKQLTPVSSSSGCLIVQTQPSGPPITKTCCQQKQANML